MDLPIQIAYVDNNNQNRSPMVHMMERYIAEHPSTSLEVTRFSDQDSFSKQISTELAAGTGADILLFDSFSTLNWRRLSERKLLVNLSEYTKNDDTFHEENYFQPVLDAGKIDGKQYVFPLAFNCTCLYTTQENLEDYNNASTRSYQEVLGLMSQSLQKAKEEDRIPVAFDLNTADYFTVLLSAFQLPIADQQTGTVLLSEEALRPLCDLLKEFGVSAIDESLSNQRKYLSQSAFYPQIEFYLCNYGFPTKMGFHQLMMEEIEETQAVILFPAYNTQAGATASVPYYGAVNENSSQKPKAYQVLRELMDTASDESIGWNFPVNRATFEKWVSEHVLGTEWSMEMDGSSCAIVHADPYGEQLYRTAERLNSVQIENQDLLQIVNKCMLPYLEETDSFDNCFQSAVNQLQLYLNE